MTETTARNFERGGIDAGGGGPETRVAQHRSAQGLAQAARGMLRQRDSGAIESLPAIRVPALVLVGALDERFVPSADYMAAKIPGAEKVVLAGAGHAANIDQPAAFNAAVRAFLERVTA